MKNLQQQTNNDNYRSIHIFFIEDEDSMPLGALYTFPPTKEVLPRACAFFALPFAPPPPYTLVAYRRFVTNSGKEIIQINEY